MITLVTGLWDIGRSNLQEGWSRGYDYYLSKFEELLKIENNMIIFGDTELESFVFRIRNTDNTQFILRDLSWFRNNEYFNLIQNVRTNPDWYNQISWLKESTQAKLEYYNPLVMSKMFLLNDAKILDKFNSESLFWIDAGLTNTVHSGYFINDKVLKKINIKKNKFYFVCFPYEAESEIHGFSFNKICELTNDKPNMVARGGFFGGDKESINTMNILYYDLLMNTLKNGFMGTEESIFTILLYQYTELIEYSMIESDGLMYRYFENLKNFSVNYNLNRKKTVSSGDSDIGFYVISFNSPKQFESLINSIIEYDINFLTKTKKFLLNNSTDLSTTKEYETLCKLYNFEHIKKNNLGITGGRQFIAEHFHENIFLNYYFFFEDDMFFVDTNSTVCKNGFNRHVKKLFDTCLKIIEKEKFDFLKLNFTEFFGSHETQWAWYNVPQDFREKFWPEKNKLSTFGFDPNAPNLKFKNIKSIDGVPYASGEIYLSNWPILMSREGNFKCYINHKFNFPYEQTLMSYNFQEMIKGNLNPGLLLLTPTEHSRFDFYNADLRKEC